MKNVHVKYFASVRERLGCESEWLQTQAGSVAELRTELRARNSLYHDALNPDKSVRAALNQDLVQDEHTALPDGAEVAFFPPVTGG